MGGSRIIELLMECDCVRCSIRRVKTPNYWRLYLKDPFHTVVNLRLSKVIGVMMIVVCTATAGR